MTQMLKSADKNFKTAIINVCKDLTEKKDTTGDQMEYFSREI